MPSLSDRSLHPPTWNELRTESSASAFLNELHRAVSGERLEWIVRFGNIEEYFASLIADSLDPVGAQTVFLDTLDRFFCTWQPFAFQTQNEILHVLELASAYSPPMGLLRVTQLLQHVDLDRSLTTLTRRQPVDLYFKALTTLSVYFPSPPKSKNDRPEAYSTYLDILYDALDDTRLAGYALSKLIELKQEKIDDAVTYEVVTRAGLDLQPLVALAVDPRRKRSRKLFLNALYRHAQGNKEALARLETTLELFHWHVYPTLGFFRSDKGEIRELRETYPRKKEERLTTLAATLTAVVERREAVIARVQTGS